MKICADPVGVWGSKFDPVRFEKRSKAKRTRKTKRKRSKDKRKRVGAKRETSRSEVID